MGKSEGSQHIYNSLKKGIKTPFGNRIMEELGVIRGLEINKTKNYILIPMIKKEDGKEITTIEGLADGDKLHPVQEALVNHGAIECGFCIPGQVMSAKALLDENPNPTEDDVREALAGNLCRCGNYKRIVECVLAAAKID